MSFLPLLFRPLYIVTVIIINTIVGFAVVGVVYRCVGVVVTVVVGCCNAVVFTVVIRFCMIVVACCVHVVRVVAVVGVAASVVA